MDSPLIRIGQYMTQRAIDHGTDKYEHGYLDFYRANFPHEPKKILEIGVKTGASIRLWLDVFPEAEIHAVDLFQEFDIPFTDRRVKWYQGNQCDWQLLEQLRRENFDVIIDDGSHNSRDQMITFFGLFNGKPYFIEDTHCCEEEFYRQGLPKALTAAGLFNGIGTQQIVGDLQPIHFNVKFTKGITLITC